MNTRFLIRRLTLAALLAVMMTPAVLARPKIAKLARKLLYGDESTRMAAVKAFNKLPADAQARLVPDFMVGLTDDDPKVRKYAAIVLKALGVNTAAKVPDAKKELGDLPPPPNPKEAWKEEQKLKEEPVPDARKEFEASKGKEEDPWADLKSVRGDMTGTYADMKREIDLEKKGQVTLDMDALRSESAAASGATPLASVVASLKDPDPWVRSQAARRLAMIQPAPVDTIPTLIAMLGDKDVQCRRAAAAALGSFGPLARDATPQLHTALSDPDNSVSEIAAEALQQIQQPR